jgi:hypothetical protein
VSTKPDPGALLDELDQFCTDCAIGDCESCDGGPCRCDHGVPDPARALVEEALHLRQNGERAPGGSETWRDWERRAESFLRGETGPEGEH